MHYLWSPWRMTYIQEDKKSKSCVFCHAIAHPDDPQSLVVHLGEQAYVIVNRYPYTSGHLMVVPKVHVPSIEDLDPDIRAEMMELTTLCMQLLRQVYQPQGFNVGLNIGSAAGAGIEEHVHMHIVPRWGGDTNFMASLGQTRVLPETLEDTHQRLCAAWAAQTPTPTGARHPE
jgi:ATP adenylyltransferase